MASNTTGDMFNMRGFSANNSLFVDGVRDDGLVARDVYNVEQIEVFSGPTGSDVGRTNAAGYVNLTTKTPGRAGLHAGTFTYGAADQLRATIDVNQPIAFGTPFLAKRLPDWPRPVEPSSCGPVSPLRCAVLQPGGSGAARGAMWKRPAPVWRKKSRRFVRLCPVRKRLCCLPR